MDWSMFDGDPEVIRLSASLFDRRDTDCRDFAAIKARPRMWPKHSERRRYAPWEDFPLGRVMAVLDAVEFDGDDLDEALDKTLSGGQSTVHPGVAEWVRHACVTYIDVADSFTGVRPVRSPRIVQGRSSVAQFRAMTAWGRWYESEDGARVEFRRLRMGRPFGAPDQLSTMAMAFVAGFGRPAKSHRDLYTSIPVPVVNEHPLPQRIRVIEVGLTTGTDKVLVDSSPAEIRHEYKIAVPPAAARLLSGGHRAPGQDCADCKARVSCDSLPVAPGLLGLDDRGTHRRTWSITTSRYYEVCPAQAHLRDVRLPSEWNSSDAVQRGRDVHRWLEIAHLRGVPCTEADLPADCAEELMSQDAYRQARPYLLQHLKVCPLRGPGVLTEIRPEPKIAAYDPAADVVVLANPDLLRRVNGRLVYREQKTSAAPAGITAENALSVVPQLALAVCLISAGVFGEADGLVELEQLHPDSAEPVLEFDIAKPEIVAAARAIIHQRARAWHGDITFRASPGWWCRSCPVSRWCSSAVTDGDAAFDPATGEIRTAAIADLIAEPEIDDEPPF
ncbi:hypothetical protein GCM10022419_022170 [Nonomuraea rosea]|uniref:PD-(D/E)XK endonuclease-like domain-containing protein n=1 Tax=Nonomuraea rosea TaxID=638574 RepID=A0ABP6VXQ7_9ACTN